MKKVCFLLVVLMVFVGCTKEDNNAQFKYLYGIWVVSQVDSRSIATQDKGVLDFRGSQPSYGYREAAIDDRATWKQCESMTLSRQSDLIICSSSQMDLKITLVEGNKMTYTITRSEDNSNLVGRTYIANRMESNRDGFMMGTWENLDKQNDLTPFRLVYFNNGMYDFYSYQDGQWSILDQPRSQYKLYGNLLVTKYSFNNGGTFCELWDLTPTDNKGDDASNLPTATFTKSDGSNIVEEWMVKKIAKYDLFF